jgi:polyribonucleotide nucleotidyltransferase
VIKLIEELAAEAGTSRWDWEEPKLDDGILSSLKSLAESKIKASYDITEKQERSNALSQAREEVFAELVSEKTSETDANLMATAFKKVEAELVRGRILNGDPRIDGRTTRTVRPISVRTRVLPRVHGSALFTRGETQALVTCTLGTARDEQRIDALGGEYYDRFLMHYNMPPFATGETGRSGPPKRREVGHGRLAKRGLAAVMPDLEEFGYSLRLVSEITESNGSSSMASVCGGSLALMDAGVPITSDVAGIAMGLIQDGPRFAVLSDILGDEDHLGDMDFKVAGTEKGITALQMDLKVDSVSREIMAAALEQAKEGRLHILGEMRKTLSQPQQKLSEHAPNIIKMKISVDKIREVIGKGGVTIRSITEATGANIDVEDDGSISISGASFAVCNAAKERIESITAELELGKIYEGHVTKILDFGAIVSISPNSDGLLHISQIANERVEKVTDYLSENQTIRVKVIKLDEKGRVRLSMKGLDGSAPAEAVAEG